jgi:hypothetical protein
VTTTVTPTQEAAATVGDSLARHLLSFSSGNVSAIVSQYEGNATVTWMGHGGAFCDAGLYSGSNIRLMFGTFLDRVAPALAIGDATWTVTPEANGTTVVNSTFDFAGQGPVYGIVNGTVSAQDSFEYSTTNGAWMVSQETWDFLTFSSQFPNSDSCHLVE